jgi:hypothetical protein
MDTTKESQKSFEQMESPKPSRPSIEEMARHYGYFGLSNGNGIFDSFEKAIAGFGDAFETVVRGTVRPGERFRIIVDYDPAYGYGLRQVFTESDLRRTLYTGL